MAFFRVRVLTALAWLLAAPVLCAQGTAAPPSSGKPAAAPQQTAPAPAPDPFTQIQQWDKALDRLTTELRDSATQTAVEQIRAELNALHPAIDRYIAAQRPRLPELEARLKALGDAPAAGEAEPQPVIVQRDELRRSIGELRGALRAAEEALERLDALSINARERRRDLFEIQLLDRGQSPLSPLLWRYIGRDLPIGLARLELLLSSWWDSIWSRALFVALILAAVGIWAGLAAFCAARVRELREWAEAERPVEWQRASSAGRVTLLRALPMAGAGAFAYLATREAGLLTPAMDDILFAAITSLIIVTTVQAVTKSTLAISRPHWRLLDVSHGGALRLYRRLMVLAAVHGIDFFISAASAISFMPNTVGIGQSFLSAVLIAGLIISILLIREDPDGEGGEPPRPVGPAYVRAPLWVAALAILGAAVVGYVSLARFVANQLIVTSTILILAYLLVISASALGQSMADDKSGVGAWLLARFRLDAAGRRRLALPVTLLLKALVVLAAIPLIMLLWGFDWQDISSWLRQALFGFEVGNVRISITAILIAVLLFVLAYAAAKLFQEWLDAHVMEGAGVEPGLRDSVRTGVGYLGIALAALLSVSYLGLDFSSLAIVAGALSVGVGFGLQSVVNNFVSGLILLAERPVKAGDWIVVAGHEGIVRKISVRSTEIETFDRANVIVPNSLLVAETVKNWTLHNSTGRVTVPVGVHYDSDPERVRDILMEAARDHPQVLSNPAPFVYFEDFGRNALNFVLYIYLANVNRSFAVRTDLRIAILKAFRAEGIEIPYQQADIHLHDLDLLAQVVKGADRGKDGPPSRRDYKSESEADDGEGDA